MSSDAASLYDTPKKLKCLINGQACICSHTNDKTEEGRQPTCESGSEMEQCNYVNVTPAGKEQIDYGNYANIDLNATLEKFESSLQILRSAGFSQEELDALEDIPEHDDDISTATMNTAVLPNQCCNDHSDYMQMEPGSSSSSNRNFSDNVSRISHVSDPTQHSDTDNTMSTRRSSSADFTRRQDDDFTTPRVCFTPTVLRKSGKSERINEGAQARKLKECGKERAFKTPEPRTEGALVARFRDAVKIRRSSSVPSKSDKNRDSSSSNDSGVSTGSLKHHRGDFNEMEADPTNPKTHKKHLKSGKQFRNTLTPVHTPFIKSNSSDPLKHLTFQFEEVATLAKSNSFDVDTLTRRKKKTGELKSFIGSAVDEIILLLDA